ncbi:MAG: hypothetical protein LBR55_03765 [Bacteroidales bacterium]|jgi:hypothetical protein|nr:hypothetical protein [Bacteroidales bacterium]
MIKIRLNLRNIAMIIAGLTTMAMFSACEKEDEWKMCWSEGYNNVYDGEVRVQCVTSNCSSGSRSNVPVREYKTYKDFDACYADMENAKRILSSSGGGNGNYGSSGSNNGGTNGGSKPAMCNGDYIQPMPNGYVQSNVFCEYAHLYICEAGYSPSSAEVKEVCETYRIFQTHDELKDCKYCQ